MIETFTLSLGFAGVDQLLAKQAEACTPTKALNGTQTAITSGTFEQQWGIGCHRQLEDVQAGQRRQRHMGTQPDPHGEQGE